MNAKIITHLFKTDWLRLRGLIAATWLLMLLASWPALTFSAERFDAPPGARPVLNGSIQAIIETGGGNFGLPGWVQTGSIWLSMAAGVALAAALGFHSRSWTQARPARRREAVVAKMLALLLFVSGPAALLAGGVALAQGLGGSGALVSASGSLRQGLPLAAGICLFGVLCGGLWRWFAGLFALVVAFMILPPLLVAGGGRGLIYLLLADKCLWGCVAVLCVVVLMLGKHEKAVIRIGTAILCMLAVTLALPREIPTWASGIPLPKWKGAAEPVLASLELAGGNTANPDRWGSRPQPGLPVDSEKFELALRWETSGLPSGTSALWQRKGKAEIRSGGRLITSGSEELERGGFLFLNPDLKHDTRMLDVAVSPDRKGGRWTSVDYSGVLTDGPAKTSTFFHPIDSVQDTTASLDIDLEGTVYRYEKLLDTPFGPPVHGMVGNMKVHVRRLELPEWQPAVDICYVVSEDPSGRDSYLSYHVYPGRDWIPVLYFPDTGEYRLLDRSMSASREATLAPGCRAVRMLYLTQDRMKGRPEESPTLANARLMILRKVALGTVTKHVRSSLLPLVVNGSQNETAVKRRFREPPPFRLRPDPAVATAGDLTTWLIRSYDGFDFEGYGRRDLADFVPRHLDLLLGRTGFISPPSSVEGKAIILACPESRRGEVIAAFPRRNGNPQYNWLSEVILRRGWTKAAEEEIRKIVAKGEFGGNPFTRMLIARLEDPRTYPALVEEEMWPDLYQAVLRLPGIEPVVEESFERLHAAARRDDPGWNVGKELGVSGLAAANGNPKAFANLFGAWSKGNEEERESSVYSMRELLRIPENLDSRNALSGWMRGKSARDFEYDRLARLWSFRKTPQP